MPPITPLHTTSFDSVSDNTSYQSSSRSSTPASPSVRRRPASLRLNHLGIDPSEIIGKTLRRARRSSVHPAVTLDFTDDTSVQILVDGYDPVHRGIPKELEMDAYLADIFSSAQPVVLDILDCALITLSDKAFERKHQFDPNEVQWDQNHLGVAFKFSEEKPRWHCVWASMEERDASEGVCLFRSYDDVYLERLQRSPNKGGRRNSRVNTRDFAR